MPLLISEEENRTDLANTKKAISMVPILFIYLLIFDEGRKELLIGYWPLRSIHLSIFYVFLSLLQSREAKMFQG